MFDVNFRPALRSTARIATPEDLAAFLASYAREARARVEDAPLKTLDPVKKALGDSLGISFEGEKGEHFFRSTLIQTLFYGIFSAWVLWHESHPKTADRFEWKNSAWHLGLPVLRTLFVQLADPTKVRALHLEEVLDWTEACLARVDRFAFFARYDMGEAVQYFYEPFLAAFDPELRKDFGWVPDSSTWSSARRLNVEAQSPPVVAAIDCSPRRLDQSSRCRPAAWSCQPE